VKGKIWKNEEIMLIKQYSKYESGQGLIEVALILVLAAVAALLALNTMGVGLKDVYCQVVGGIGGPVCEAFEDGVTCTSSFDDPSALDDWEGKSKDKYLSVEDGKMCNSGTTKSFFNGCSEAVGDSDFTANLNGITIEETKKGYVGVDFWFRAQDENNGYRFTYNSKGNFVRFWKNVNGKWISLQKTSVPSDWGNQELDFQIQAEGDTFTAYKDGTPIIQASDDAFTEGKYGLRNKTGSKICIDEITVQQNP